MIDVPTNLLGLRSLYGNSSHHYIKVLQNGLKYYKIVLFQILGNSISDQLYKDGVN